MQKIILLIKMPIRRGDIIFKKMCGMLRAKLEARKLPFYYGISKKDRNIPFYYGIFQFFLEFFKYFLEDSKKN